MTPQEVAAVLTAIAAIDDRIDPDQMRIAMWCEVLYGDMTFEFARQTVINHYAQSRNVIMPADLNSPWKIERAKINQRERDAIEKSDTIKLGEMPIDFQAKLRAIATGKSIA